LRNSFWLAAAGFEIVAGFDNARVAVDTYSRNFNHPAFQLDLAKHSGAELMRMAGSPERRVDLIAGGPPCQGFSIQRIGENEDVRNHLVMEFARIVAELKPRIFFMENVPGLLGMRGTELVTRFKSYLESAGYRVNHKIINAADYDVPQLRKRVIFFGTSSLDQGFEFPHPIRTRAEFRTVRDALGDLPSPPKDCSPTPGDPLHRRTRLSQLNQMRIEMIPPGGGMKDLPNEMRADCHKVGADAIGHRFVYGRLAPDEPAATITARFDSFTRGKFGHPWEARNITLREGARLQSFPDTFVFCGTQEEIAALIGNAVPPHLSSHLGIAARKFLERSTPRTSSGMMAEPLVFAK